MANPTNALQLLFTALEPYCLDIWIDYDSSIINYDRWAIIRLATGSELNGCDLLGPNEDNQVDGQAT